MRDAYSTEAPSILVRVSFVSFAALLFRLFAPFKALAASWFVLLFASFAAARDDGPTARGGQGI